MVEFRHPGSEQKSMVDLSRQSMQRTLEPPKQLIQTSHATGLRRRDTCKWGIEGSRLRFGVDVLNWNSCKLGLDQACIEPAVSRKKRRKQSRIFLLFVGVEIPSVMVCPDRQLHILFPILDPLEKISG